MVSLLISSFWLVTDIDVTTFWVTDAVAAVIRRSSSSSRSALCFALALVPDAACAVQVLSILPPVSELNLSYLALLSNIVLVLPSSLQSLSVDPEMYGSPLHAKAPCDQQF